MLYLKETIITDITEGSGIEMRIAVCEDEQAYAEALEKKVLDYFGTLGFDCGVEVYRDGESLLREGGTPDLVFLDCRLPDMNGLAVAERLRERDPAPVIVFLSAYSEYVFESFKVGTFRYLLKSMPDTELYRTLDDFLAQFDRDVTLNVPTKEGALPMRLRNIVYIESMRKSSIVRYKKPSGDGYLYCESTRSLAEYAELIRSPRFFRTHKRFLVNMSFIERIEKNVIDLPVGEHAEISRRRMTAFNKAYNVFLRNSL